MKVINGCCKYKFSYNTYHIISKDEVGGGVLYVGGWDAAEDIAGLQAAGVRYNCECEHKIIMGNFKIISHNQK